MKIAIVANGASLLTLKKGKEIDSHDIVIRQNQFYLMMEPETTGMKTDIWACCFNKQDMYLEESPYMPNKIWCTRPSGWTGSSTTTSWFIPNWASPKIVKYLTDYDRSHDMVKAVGGTNPTTGWNTIYMADKEYPNVVKDLYGYDFYEPNRYYYQKDDIAFPVKNHHNPQAEKRLILQGVEQGKYNWIH